MTKEGQIMKIENLLDNMDADTLIYYHNEFCEYAKYYDDRIYYFEELDELCYGMTPTEIVSTYGNLEGCDYFKCGVYVESADLYDVDTYEIASYCVNYECDLGNSDICEILESEDEDEEDEE